MTQEIQIGRHGRVQTIRINRPEKKNALTLAMYEAMEQALVSGDKDPDVAAHVFLGAPGIFCAGNDIKDFLARATSGGLGNHTTAFIRRLPVVEKPMIAAVDGLAVGIGTTMLFHCDLVYASPTTVLQTPFLDLGIVPEAASSLIAPHRMGYARAFELLCLGEPFNAERAHAAGIINKIVPAAELEATALKAADRLAKKPPEALAAARRLMRGDPSAILAQMDKEIALFAERLQSAEAKEAFTAFLEKRPPDFVKLKR